MHDIKSAVAKNIAELRQERGMTQLELAEKLNYSDKAISKWEHAESMPDIAVLVELSELFGVSLDYLVQEEHPREPQVMEKRPRYRHGVITAVSVVLVWLIAMVVFVPLVMVKATAVGAWLSFIYAIPVSAIVWLVFNSIWFNRKINYLIISILMWSVLGAIHLSVLLGGFNIALIYLLGIPGQLIILLWSLIKRRSK